MTQPFQWLCRAVQDYSLNSDAYLVLAASYGHLGRTEEATHMMHKFAELTVDKSDSPNLVWRYKHQENYDHLLDGLRKAGLQSRNS